MPSKTVSEDYSIDLLVYQRAFTNKIMIILINSIIDK